MDNLIQQRAEALALVLAAQPSDSRAVISSGVVVVVRHGKSTVVDLATGLVRHFTAAEANRCEQLRDLIGQCRPASDAARLLAAYAAILSPPAEEPGANLPHLIAEETREISAPAMMTRNATVETGTYCFLISSEEPYLRADDRGPYWELLGHGDGEVDDSRMAKGLPFLFGHDQDKPLGRAGTVRNIGGTLRASSIVWSRSEFAQQIKGDYDAGAYREFSVGYRCESYRVTGEKDGIPIRRYKWTPHEFSLVPVGADPNCIQ